LDDSIEFKYSKSVNDIFMFDWAFLISNESS